ncbi:MAG: RND transporter [Thiomargarita sp.]|nr:RND transporter [Thiomargarita sp.]
MKKIITWIEELPWNLLIFGSLTLGLAPFFPEPHLIEKVRMLFQGVLSRPIDIFDLVMHGIFPLLLTLKSVNFCLDKIKFFLQLK